MSDDEAEEMYSEVADEFEEDEEYSNELDEEESEEEKEDEEEPELDYEAEIEEKEREYKFIPLDPIIQKINEADKNHRIIIKRPREKFLSSNVICLPEITEAIGVRISQFEQGAPPLTDVSGLTSPIDMAKKEFIDRQNPLKLWRPMKTTETTMEVEEWKVREMTYLVSDREILDLTMAQIDQVMNKKK